MSQPVDDAIALLATLRAGRNASRYALDQGADIAMRAAYRAPRGGPAPRSRMPSPDARRYAVQAAAWLLLAAEALDANPVDAPA